MEPSGQNRQYQQRQYTTKQMRDTASGSDTVKRANQMYLPMPSGFAQVQTMNPGNTTSTGPLGDDSVPTTAAPWYHPNPAYSAYLHRARFPDMVANTKRGLKGVATRKPPLVVLPPTIAYMEDLATQSGKKLTTLFGFCVSEVMLVGRVALVADVRPDGTFYLATYTSETYIDWSYTVIDGARVQNMAAFETVSVDSAGTQTRHQLKYILEQADPDAAWLCVAYRFTNGKQDAIDGRTEVAIQGTPLTRLPVFNIGSEENTPEVPSVPLIGVADCALDLYRHSADLNQGHFMTCNPTLLFTGVHTDDAPTTIGSTVAIALSNKDADGKYLTPSADSFDHVLAYMETVFGEAVQYGASLLGPSKRAAESAEALSMRQAASGATLVDVVVNAGDGITAALEFIAVYSGANGEVEFTPNIEFAELSLSAQDITALVNGWMSGGFSHNTLLDNMASAGRLGERTVEQELDLIEEAVPTLTPVTKTTAEEIVVAPEAEE